MLRAEQAIELLGLKPLTVEGGFFFELYRSPRTLPDGRTLGTSIYYLLRRGDRSCWHCVKSDEIWYYHAGAPAIQTLIDDAGRETRVRIGSDLANGERPQSLIPGGVWQTAWIDPDSEYDWGLFGAAVFPGFEYADFQGATDAEMAAIIAELRQS